MLSALTHHWPEFLIEGALLGAFMLSACFFVVLLEHPDWPGRRRIASPLARRTLVGLAMGATAVVLIYSPWGQRSGAHMNPSVTLAFLGLGRIAPWDAAFYVLAQFAGGTGGVLAARAALGQAVGHGSVNFVMTSPGPRGPWAAWIAEFGIGFGLMAVVLVLSNMGPLAAYTGLAAGALVGVYITVEAPLSGMSLNPARTLGSALFAREFGHLWVYFTAPPAAMLAAAGMYASVRGADHVYCAKLAHGVDSPCVFRCRIERMEGGISNPGPRPGIQGPAPSPAPDAAPRAGRPGR